MARVMTIPVQAPIAWAMRAPMSISTVGAIAQAKLASVNTVMPMSSGILRPNRSDSGPMISWAEAKAPR